MNIKVVRETPSYKLWSGASYTTPLIFLSVQSLSIHPTYIPYRVRHVVYAPHVGREGVRRDYAWRTSDICYAVVETK